MLGVEKSWLEGKKWSRDRLGEELGGIERVEGGTREGAVEFY